MKRNIKRIMNCAIHYIGNKYKSYLCIPYRLYVSVLPGIGVSGSVAGC